MISLEEALARLREGVEASVAASPLGSERLPLSQCLNRVLTVSPEAGRASPARACSAMDGWALRASDTLAAGTASPIRLRSAGERAAGTPAGTPASTAGTLTAGTPAGTADTTPADTLAPGTALRVFTGSLLPHGADAILLQEDAVLDSESHLLVSSPAQAGRWVREQGRDFAAGTHPLPCPRRLTPKDLALAAALNCESLTVAERPRVAVLSTGTELTPPGLLDLSQAAHDALVPASSRPALEAAVRNWGGAPFPCPLVPDNAQATAHALAAALESTPKPRLLITTGGASFGRHDLVVGALESLGWRPWFHRVSMKPGMPSFAGSLEDSLVIGLPGNPVSSLVVALLFARPALHRLLGLAFDPLPWRKVRLSAPLAAGGKRFEFVRARTSTPNSGDDPLPHAAPVADSDSSLVSVLASADWLLFRPPDAPALESGHEASALRLDELGL